MSRSNRNPTLSNASNTFVNSTQTNGMFSDTVVENGQPVCGLSQQDIQPVLNFGHIHNSVTSSHGIVQNGHLNHFKHFSGGGAKLGLELWHLLLICRYRHILIC